MTAIALQTLSFAWPKQPAVIDIASLQIERGERVFLKGASGSGKSTLLALIAGVLRPAPGSQIDVLGTALHSLRSGSLDQFRADHLGFVFQLFNLLPYLSVLENVLLPARFSPARRRKALRTHDNLEQAGLSLLGALGLSPTLARRDVLALSVGQQQRVALARALLGEPELIICDEPTSAIDMPQRDAFMKTLIEQVERTGASLLCVSHDPGLEHFFTRTIALAQLNRASATEAI
jgi:putative ABC transport system ATP-binding protein